MFFFCNPKYVNSLQVEVGGKPIAGLGSSTSSRFKIHIQSAEMKSRGTLFDKFSKFSNSMEAYPRSTLNVCYLCSISREHWLVWECLQERNKMHDPSVKRDNKVKYFLHPQPSTKKRGERPKMSTEQKGIIQIDSISIAAKKICAPATHGQHEETESAEF